MSEPFELPALRSLQGRFVATEPARVPSLFTVSLHGALGSALMALSPANAPRSAYRDLFEPRPDAAELGTTTFAPSPLVLAPDKPVTQPHPQRLNSSDPLGFRVTLVGDAAGQWEGLLIAALRRAGQLGLGTALDANGEASRDGGKPRHASFGLEDITRLVVPPLDAPASEAVLDFWTPLRLRYQKKLVSEISSEALWAVLRRRASLLAACHGKPLPLPPEEAPCPIEVSATSTRIVPIRRYSSRQKQCMVWPGILGTVNVRRAAGADDASWEEAWTMLRFGEWAQLGKATSFGFGRFEMTGVG